MFQSAFELIDKGIRNFLWVVGQPAESLDELPMLLTRIKKSGTVFTTLHFLRN